MVQLAFSVFHLLQTAFGGVQTILKPLFDPFQFLAPAFLLRVHGGPPAHLFLFDRQLHLLGASLGLGNDACGLLFCTHPHLGLALPFAFDPALAPTVIGEISGDTGGDNRNQGDQNDCQ